MKLTYDPRHNVAYFSFGEPSTQVETVRVSDDLNVDLAPDGRVFGIELLNANEQLHGRMLLLVNEASGRTMEVELPA